MVSFYRSGLLALTLMSVSMTDLQAQTQRMFHNTWVSDVSVERLQDKSVLTEYFGEVVSKEHEDVIFRVGFIPRFGCAPLITFKFGADALTFQRLDDGRDSFPADLSAMSVTIDGVAMAFPALVDDNADNTSVYLNADLQRRLTSRLRVKIGSRMRVKFSSGKTLNFSLLGSRDAISIANQNCRRHDPSIQG